MGDGTEISWTDATWNPLIGCSRVSAACDHCYAISTVHRGMADQHKGLTIRLPGEHAPGERLDWTGEVREVPHLLDQPLRWTRPRRVFVNSLSDVFHPEVSRDYIARMFAVMALAERHTFQILTKRPSRMAKMLADPSFVDLVDQYRLERDPLSFRLTDWPRPNIWLGTTIEGNESAWRADKLRATPAAVRFISAEPLLGPLGALDLTGIDWLIVGGESGPGARPMHEAWANNLRDRAVDGGVAFHFKQHGDWAPFTGREGRLVPTRPKSWDGFNERHDLIVTDPDGRERRCEMRSLWEFPRGTRWSDSVDGSLQHCVRIGKKAAGRLLAGRVWAEFPDEGECGKPVDGGVGPCVLPRRHDDICRRATLMSEL